MTKFTVAVAGCILVVAAQTSLSDSQKPHPDKTNESRGHQLVILRAEAEWKQAFSYLPYPLKPYGPLPSRALGIYRLMIDPQGEVTEIKILATMGRVLDAAALKALIKWRAKPTCPRMVAVELYYGPVSGGRVYQTIEVR